jgi:hypothetical protein
MGLRLKFNLVLIVVFVIGLGVAGFMSYQLLHKNAQDEVLRNAGVMMEAALSMRGYTVGKVRPLLPYDPDKFLPESVPAPRSCTCCRRSIRTTRTRKRRSTRPIRATGRSTGRATS